MAGGRGAVGDAMQEQPDPTMTTRRDVLQVAAGLGVAGTLATPADGAPIRRVDRRGVPGARNVDHAGVVVRDLDEATRFFVEVIGADLLFRSPPAAGLEGKEEAADGTTVEVAFLRFGPNLNLELLQFTGPKALTSSPRVSDNGAVHVAIWVDDVARAADHLRAQPGVEIVGDIGRPSAGADKGATWIYARTPFGVHLELVHRPAHMPYERDVAARFYGPAPAWG